MDAFALIGVSLRDVLLEIEWSSYAHGRADTLRLVLDDRDKAWTDDLFPNKGARLGATLSVEDWPELYGGPRQTLDMGIFEIDRFEVSSPPRTVTIGALSAYITQSMRTEERTKAWQDYDLKRIASEIATRHGLSIIYAADSNPTFDRIEQKETPDLRFLRELSEDYNLSLKVAGGVLLVTDDEAMHRLLAGTIAEEGPGDLFIVASRYEITDQAWDLVAACELRYDDPLTDASVIIARAADERARSGETLRINERISNGAQAQLRARAALARRNREETVATMTLLGTPAFVAGVAVRLVGFGEFDGRYIIEQSTHRMTKALGYETTLGLRKYRSDGSISGGAS